MEGIMEKWGRVWKGKEDDDEIGEVGSGERGSGVNAN